MSENLKTKKCVVAFIDLLGTSEAIKNDENDTNLYTMNYICKLQLICVRMIILQRKRYR